MRALRLDRGACTFSLYTTYHICIAHLSMLSSKLLRLRYCCIVCVGDRTYSFDSEEVAVRGRIPLLTPLWGAQLLIKRHLVPIGFGHL